MARCNMTDLGRIQDFRLTLWPSCARLYDIHGNVAEWTQNFYAKTFAGGVDPTGPATGDEHVAHGSSWLSYSGWPRPRQDFASNRRLKNLGFRLVREPR